MVASSSARASKHGPAPPPPIEAGAWAKAMLVAAVLVAGIVYGYFAVNPYAHTPLKPFLAMFARSGAAAWPMQVLWWAVAGALVVLALSGVRHSERWVAALAGAYFAWVGIAFFAWLNPSMNLASLWAATFAVEGALFV